MAAEGLLRRLPPNERRLGPGALLPVPQAAEDFVLHAQSFGRCALRTFVFAVSDPAELPGVDPALELLPHLGEGRPAHRPTCYFSKRWSS